MPQPSHPTQLSHFNCTCDEYKSRSSSLRSFLHFPITLSLIGPRIISRGVGYMDVVEAFLPYRNATTYFCKFQ
jgi:hypothetical protein